MRKVEYAIVNGEYVLPCPFDRQYYKEPNKPLRAIVNGNYCRNVCGCYKGDNTKKEYIKCNCDELERNGDAPTNE